MTAFIKWMGGIRGALAAIAASVLLLISTGLLITTLWYKGKAAKVDVWKLASTQCAQANNDLQATMEAQKSALLRWATQAIEESKRADAAALEVTTLTGSLARSESARRKALANASQGFACSDAVLPDAITQEITR